MSALQLNIWLLTFTIAFCGCMLLPRKISTLYRRMRGDMRIAKINGMAIHCPRCNGIVTGIFPEGVFHERCEASPLAHLHWICGTCKKDCVVKP